MKIIQGDQAPDGAGTTYRAGNSSHKILLEGEPGTLGNFSLVMACSPGRYSPRHRHNFEQIRFQLEGTANYGKTGKLKPGMVGFYPEAVHYGPQTQEEGSFLSSLVLQNGGSSGCGYVSRGESAAAVKELEKIGEFVNGAFKMPKGMNGLPGGTQGKRNLDGAQAIWEYVNKKPMEYPAPRYEQAILLDPENFTWRAYEDQTGVQVRRLGTFTEAESAISFFHVAAGSSFKATGGRDIYFVYTGTGTVEDTEMRFTTTVYLDPGESAVFEADTDTTILNLHLPNLDYIEAGLDDRARVAAE